MLKKTITYKNPFTDEEVTEDFYFHISKAAIVRMDVEEHKETYTDSEGQELTGMRAKMQRIVDAEDGKALMPLFEDIIKRSYGRKDGTRFIQSESEWEDFKGSGAFDELLFTLCTNVEQAAEFVNGAMPGDLEELAEEARKKAEAQSAEPSKATAVATKVKARAAKRKPAAGQRQLEDSPAIAAVDKIEREQEIASATTETPVALTRSEMIEMDSSDFQTGLASGKFTIQAPESFDK